MCIFKERTRIEGKKKERKREGIQKKINIPVVFPPMCDLEVYARSSDVDITREDQR
jgi:hypothetical protein